MTTMLLLGLLIGLALGVTGAGGGILAVPLLMAAAHVPLTAAAPMGLAAVALAATLGAVLAFRAGRVRYRAAALMAACGLVASPMGLWLAHRVPTAPLTLGFAVLMAWIAWTMWRGQPSRTSAPAAADQETEASAARAPCLLDHRTGRLCWTPGCARALAGMGTAAGALSGLLGVGGGFVIVPGLQRFTDMTLDSAVGTSLAVVALVSAWGVAVSSATGRLDVALAAPFALGAGGGMVVARSVSARLPAAWVRKGFALLAACVALGMVLSLLAF